MNNYPDIGTLVDMLSYMRPTGSRAERQFIREFIRPTGATPDDRGNYILRVGKVPVLWSAHTDTVHWQGGRQLLDISGGYVSAPRSNCLGADDTTGCWLLLNLIKAGVEGLYIFHRAEEVGCLGSSHIAKNTPELLDDILFAIAFDRRGYDSVVTHQCGMRTASDAFAESLAAGLDLGYLPDNTGIYTDTVEYAGLIPECTNLSVGYENAHSKREVQDLGFAEALRDAVLSLDLGSLEVGEKKERGYLWQDEDEEEWYDEEGEWDYCDMCGGLAPVSEIPGGLVCSGCARYIDQMCG